MIKNLGKLQKVSGSTDLYEKEEIQEGTEVNEVHDDVKI